MPRISISLGLKVCTWPIPFFGQARPLYTPTTPLHVQTVCGYRMTVSTQSQTPLRR
jgi:hypothetical protein